MKKSVVSFLVLGCWLVSLGAFAGVGGIRGTVMDQDFEVPMPGVKVRVSETGQETQTVDSGSYFLEGVKPGAYTLLFSKEGYTHATKTQVVVTPGQLTEADVSMAGEYNEMDELVVHDIQLGGSSEIGLLNLRMKSPALMDSIGANLMSQAGVSDAAQAVRLVPGATVQDGKYAVIRGLPDRYVSSQMNGVRLPTADEDKRAVQLDQFPSALIESVQVKKTFTPDQQGDASGGAVNVVLKGIPDKAELTAGVGGEINSQVWANRDSFLTYRGGGVNFWGNGTSSRAIPSDLATQTPTVGTSRGKAPYSYSWDVGAGDKYTFDSGMKVGGFANFFYKHDASYYKNGVQDKYSIYNDGSGTGDQLLPQIFGASGTTFGSDDYLTQLYDTEQSVDEVQWGGLGSIGLEAENNKLALIYMQTHVAEDKVTLLQDTRGKAMFDPSNAHPLKAPYNRSQALDYTERDTQTLQFNGHHTIPLPLPPENDVFNLLDPEINWFAATSSAGQDTPDKRLFTSEWFPASIRTNPRTGQSITNAPHYFGVKSAENYNAGYFQRIWKNIEEDSDQYSINAKLPFKQWSDSKGYLKLGVFNDKVDRTYRMASYSNQNDSQSGYGPGGNGLDWSQLWSDYWTVSPTSPMKRNDFSDADYDGQQKISAWYYMADLPLFSFMDVIGGTRFESTDLKVDSIPVDSSTLYMDLNSLTLSVLQGSAAEHVHYSQDDMLPSLGFEIRPWDTVKLRAAYAETVARQTFKELAPVQQSEYFGADTFVGNPALKMSSLKNYDLRADYNPYPGGLVSLSWFYKSMTDPIEYVLNYSPHESYRFTAPVNYPSGTMKGYEAEVRQQLGKWWHSLEGLSLGVNATVIDSEVQLPQREIENFALAGHQINTRRMMGAPDYLFNANLTYDLGHFGTQLGLFYNYTGEILYAGQGIVVTHNNSSGGDSLIESPAIYEMPYGSLNFSLSQKLGKYWKVAFKAKNLTDPVIKREYRFFGQTATRSSYTKGIDYSLGVSAKW